MNVSTAVPSTYGSMPTAVDTASAIVDGALTAADAAAACLAAARERDGRIGAFRSLDDTYVDGQLREDEGRPAGPLSGVAFGVKDVIDTAALPTGYGSALFADHQPARDAAVVIQIRAAGGIVLGKTESTEFAMYQPTRTRNPVDLRRTPGGSSSGSAAAVAAGMVPVALGTQTAGSVVRPAAYCGVYGFKPSRGWISTEGIWRLAESLDTVGIFARTAADLDLTYRSLAESPCARPDSSRTAVLLRCEEWSSADDDTHRALDTIAESLLAQGWSVAEAPMPLGWTDLPGWHATVMAVEVARNLTEGLGERVTEISPAARAVVERGLGCTPEDYDAARRGRDEALIIAQRLAVVGDVLLVPSALGAAPLGLEFTGDPVMCRPATLLGLPASNVPGHTNSEGLPIGVQAIGLQGDDLRFLADLAAIEATLRQPMRWKTATTPRKGDHR